MESILENISIFEDLSLRGFVFGFVHVSLILIGYYTGWSINRFLKILSKGYIAGIIGAASAHVIADLVASLIDPSIRPMTIGIVIGGIIPLLFIPILKIPIYYLIQKIIYGHQLNQSYCNITIINLNNTFF